MSPKKINKKRVVIGIDPGFDRVGIAIIEKEKNKKEILIFSTCIKTKRTDSFEKRLLVVGEAVSFYIKKYKPSELAIEKLFFTTNQKTAMGVSEARGVCVYLGIKNKLILGEYTPLQIKMAITGYGRADKKDLPFMLEKLIFIPKNLKRLRNGCYCCSNNSFSINKIRII
jgi:crossover junction endodeoxyribonuclease RuvC